MEKVSVVIPVYGQWNMVERNINQLLRYEGENIKEIIVVDDCSRDKNPYIFDDSIVMIIRNPENLGYTATVNKGLKMATSDIILLLDSDACPIESFIKKLIELYKDHVVGCIGFRTVDETGKETGSFERFEPTIIGLIVGQRLQLKFDELGFWRKKLVLPYSCCISFRKQCLQQLNYFDENSFPVLEADNDISMRVHSSEWKLIFTKEITFCHKGGNSYKINYKRLLLYHESRWRLLKKHGKLKHPSIVKKLLQTRIKIELLILKFLLMVGQNNIDLKEKIKGRKILLQKVVSFS